MRSGRFWTVLILASLLLLFHEEMALALRSRHVHSRQEWADTSDWDLRNFLSFPDPQPYHTAAADTGEEEDKKRPDYTPEDSPADATRRGREEEESPLLLDEPENVEVTYELAEDGSGFYVYEQVDGQNIRPPSFITYQEFLEMEEKRNTKNYFQKKSGSRLGNVGDESLIPPVKVDSRLFETLFGSTKIDIQPNVSVLMDFSGRVNKMANPMLSQAQQRNTSFNFDQQIQMNVVGRIGEKMELKVSYDTEAGFTFDNEFKLQYEGKEDDIIKSIEAGNVSMPLNGSLISGGQNLWGVKTKLQFGPVFLTALASQQRGQTNEITVRGGNQETPFDKKASLYDENRHFFLCHYFRSQYERSLQSLPQVNSRINVVRAEVWVTNRNGQATQNNRNALGFVDLGENTEATGGRIWNKGAVTATGRVADNRSNTLYDDLLDIPEAREKNTAISSIRSNLGLNPNENNEDFVRVDNMRQLTEREYTLNRELGYISLNSRLQPNDVLFVAFEYTITGDADTVYKVGEFTNEAPSNGDNSNVLFLKMLRPPAVRPQLEDREYPTWDLMMKNIYSIGGYNLSPDDFRFEIVYESTDGNGDLNYLPTSDAGQRPLIQVFGVDTLTNNMEPGADGRFDFVPGVTVIPNRGLIVFPVLEPFGSHLVDQFENNKTRDSTRYAYTALYDRTQQDAIQLFPNQNRYKFRGSYTGSSVNSTINLNAVQIAEGSITVTAGGVQLQEGVDYTANYQVGQVTILNQGILDAGQEIKIRFESNTLFGIDQKSLLGLRLDYAQNDNMRYGLTFMHLNERPLINKINLGDEPLKNSIWGFDFAIDKEVRLITTLLDRIPWYSTNTPSNINFTGEFAHLIPGLPSQIKTEEENGIAYLDDFEGTRSVVDLTGILFWRLASRPANLTLGETPEGLEQGYNRAKLAWYLIDPVLYDQPGQFGLSRTDSILNDHRQRRVEPQEVFPNRTVQGRNILATFDLHYFPRQRGMYNFVANPDKVNPDGSLQNPRENWAGIMRRTSGQTDFEAANFEFIEFWMMDPFAEDPDNPGGKLFFNLGQVSEDVLSDQLPSFEHGLPNNEDNYVNGVNVDTTEWGRAPLTIPPTNAFDSDPNAREFQDVGLDGLRSDHESDVDEAAFFSQFLDDVSAAVDPAVLDSLQADPSSDDFRFFRDYPEGTSILERYKDFNGMEGNSEPNQPGEAFSRSATPNPDVEDLNADGTLSFAESYWEYEMDIRPGSLTPGSNFVVDTRTQQVELADGTFESITWYQFRIPLREGASVNDIQDFKSIDFIRMYLTDWTEDVVMRFGKFELVATQWRTYLDWLGPEDEVRDIDPTADPTTFDVATINIEENGNKQPFNYVLPPDIERQQVAGSAIPGLLMNEQSIVMRICDLQDGDARGIFRNMNFDLRNYERLKMWVHAEADNNGSVPANFDQCGDLNVFIRIGTDYTENYYEYEMPICPSEPGAGAANTANIWPDSNEIDFALDLLPQSKVLRNQARRNGQIRFNERYPRQVPERNGHTVYVKGNPMLNNVKSILIGVRNTRDQQGPVCVEVWVNELRVTDFNTTNGWAANARLNMKLADLATIQMSGSFSSAYFGGLEQRISERPLEEFRSYDILANVSAGKLLPEALGMEIPFTFTLGERWTIPVYNPLDPDVRLETVLATFNPGEQDSIFNRRIKYERVFGYSFNNVRHIRTKEGKKPMPWDLANWDFTFAYNERFMSSAQIEFEARETYKFGVGYTFNWQPPKIQPFKGEGSKRNLLTEFNIIPLPKAIGVRLDGNRDFDEQKLRTFEGQLESEPTYQQNFLITRTYQLQWDLATSLNFTYNATNISRVDEPRGRLDTEAKRDSFWNSFVSFGRDTAAGRYNLINIGRTTQFNQNFTLSYRLPFTLVKPLNWITASANYNANFSWQTAALQNQNLGNTISNGRSLQGSGQMQFRSLYRKLKFLQKWKKPIPKKTIYSLRDSTREEGDDLKVAFKRVGKAFAHLVFSIQSIDFSYNLTQSATIPGYLPRTDNFGLDFNYYDPETDQTYLAPGVGFIMGVPPDLSNELWLREQTEKGWFSSDSLFSSPFNASTNTNLNGRISLEPYKGIRIDLQFNRQSSESFSGVWSFVDTNSAGDAINDFVLSNQTLTGNLSISTFTGFGLFSAGGDSSAQFNTFSDNRRIVSERLRAEHPRYGDWNDTAATPGLLENGYYNGYTESSPDVLVPAFISAYGPYKVDGVDLSGLPKIPLPNWTLTYNGLSSIDALRKVFKSITLRHAYRGTYSASYLLNLNAQVEPGNFYSDNVLRVDSLEDDLGDSDVRVNYQPRFNFTSITVTESWSPLLGINLEFNNGISAQLDYKMDRTLNLNVGTLQLTENINKAFTLNLSWRKDRFLKPITIFGKEIELKNQIVFRFETTVRNTTQMNRRLDSDQPPEFTGGTMNLTIKPSIDYTVSQQLTVRAYAEHNRNAPVLSTSFPTSFTAFGVQVRFTLNP